MSVVEEETLAEQKQSSIRPAIAVRSMPPSLLQGTAVSASSRLQQELANNSATRETSLKRGGREEELVFVGV